MANLTQKMYLTHYRPYQTTTVVNIDQNPVTMITEPPEELPGIGGGTIRLKSGTNYVAGPIIDRLAAFESIDMEPNEIKELIKNHIPMKVRVDREFAQYQTLLPTGKTFTSVKETRTYRCPCCGTKLDERYKTTKLYPNRTVGTEGVTRNCVQHQCRKCKQALDWDEANKEEWS